MDVVLCDLDAWTLFASRASLDPVPKVEANRILGTAACDAAVAEAVRSLPWRRELEGHLRVLTGAAPRDDIPVHLLSPPGSRRHRVRGLVSHRTPSDLPDGSLVAAPGEVFSVSPELYLMLRARELPVACLAVVASMLWGRYSLRLDDADGAAVRCEPRGSCAAARSYAERCEGLWSPRADVACVLDAMGDGSRSPMETALNALLCLPEAKGGYGLPKPELNHTVFLDRNQSYALRGQRRCEIDLLWPDRGVGVEYDGGEHFSTREAQERDRARDAVMREMGLDVVRWTWPMVRDEVSCDLLVRDLARRLGERVRTGPACSRLAERRALRSLLLAPHLVW